MSGSNPVYEDSELVLGIVAPVGTNLRKFCVLLERALKTFGYGLDQVRISELIEQFRVEQPVPGPSGASEHARRLHQMMDAGNALRHSSQVGGFLALAAAEAIRGRRVEGAAMLRTAHVVRSLKHPDEVRTLRRIYGSGFYLIGVMNSDEQRRSYLADEKNCTPEEIAALLKRDEHEDDERYVGPNDQNYGQRTRDTFHLADVFVPLGDEKQLIRFLRLVFGCPFETPTPDEYAMFLAFGASLRSGDLSRQVGAVVLSPAGDVVAVGANDVPTAQGGLYWPGADDRRDHVRKEDPNEAQRDRIVRDVLERLAPMAGAGSGAGEGTEGAPAPPGGAAEWMERGRQLLKGSLLMDITEYARAAHAEMEAILSCARSGLSTRECELFCSTFPCHNCAKHIITAGIRRVVYVEPYPKSQAKNLFEDSIVLDEVPGDPPVTEAGKDGEEGRRRPVRFEAFVGIGPRRFFDLFSIALSSGTNVKRKSGGVPVRWEAASAIVRVPLLPNSYLDREHLAAEELLSLTQRPEDPP